MPLKKMCILFFLWPLASLGQIENQEFNIVFYKSDSVCKTTDSGGLTTVLIEKYRKHQNTKTGIISFYICDELFEYNPKLNVIDSIKSSAFKDIDVFSLGSLYKKYIEAQEALNSYASNTIRILFKNEFNNIWLYEQVTTNLYIRYQVQWIENIE
ncbi:MAG: hypothetical protein HC819_19350 [Cyclobacteriaceae bacterium]|nr:hypothetical protein [Cyclobacteriaceae bacterium]